MQWRKRPFVAKGARRRRRALTTNPARDQPAPSKTDRSSRYPPSLRRCSWVAGICRARTRQQLEANLLAQAIAADSGSYAGPALFGSPKAAGRWRGYPCIYDRSAIGRKCEQHGLHLNRIAFAREGLQQCERCTCEALKSSLKSQYCHHLKQ